MWFLLYNTLILFFLLAAWQYVIGSIIRHFMGPQTMPTGWRPSSLFSLLYVLGTSLALGTLLAFVALQSIRAFGVNMWPAFFSSLVLQTAHIIYLGRRKPQDILSMATSVLGMLSYVVQFWIPGLVPKFLFVWDDGVRHIH